MFAVHRKHLHTCLARLFHDNLAGHDQNFLAGDGEVLALSLIHIYQMSDLERLRHSCAHVLATAICRLWPDAQLAGCLLYTSRWLPAERPGGRWQRGACPSAALLREAGISFSFALAQPIRILPIHTDACLLYTSNKNRYPRQGRRPAGRPARGGKWP